MALTTNKRPTSFLDLPGELRNKIYRIILPEGTEFRTHIFYSPTVSALLRVGGQIRREAASIIHATNRFNFHTSRGAWLLLNQMSVEERSMIKRLGLQYQLHDLHDKRRRTDLFGSILTDLRRLRCEGLECETVFVTVRHSVVGREDYGHTGLRRNGLLVPHLVELEVVDGEDGWAAVWKGEYDEPVQSRGLGART